MATTKINSTELKKAIVNSGLSETRLSEKLGEGRNYIKTILSRGKMKDETFDKTCFILGVDRNLLIKVDDVASETETNIDSSSEVIAMPDARTENVIGKGKSENSYTMGENKYKHRTRQSMAKAKCFFNAVDNCNEYEMEYEKAFRNAICDAMTYVPSNYELDVHYDEERKGWYAYKYSKEKHEATPLYANAYDKIPLISDKTAERENVDVRFILEHMNVYVS